MSTPAKKAFFIGAGVFAAAVLATVFVFGYGAYRMHEVDARAAAAPSMGR